MAPNVGVPSSQKGGKWEYMEHQSISYISQVVPYNLDQQCSQHFNISYLVQNSLSAVRHRFPRITVELPHENMDNTKLVWAQAIFH